MMLLLCGITASCDVLFAERSGIWDAESGREVLATPARVKRLGAVGFDSIMGATAWHPKQHVIALGAFGDGSPIVLYCREVSQ
jgi:hypothetical protein